MFEYQINKYYFYDTIEKQTKRSIGWSVQVKKRNGYGETLRPMTGRFDSYLFNYEVFFKNKTKCFFDKAQIYCQGI